MQDQLRSRIKDRAGETIAGYGDYSRILSDLQGLMEMESPVIIAIDGRCGSGKTYLADWIGTLFPCNICHMDDFYLPFEKRREDWKEVPGGNMDLERFLTEVLLPVRAGCTAEYRPFHCKTNRMGEGVKLHRQRLTVVEGSYSHHPLLTPNYDRRIFLTCSKEKQRERLKIREGFGFLMFEEQWIPMEEEYLQSFDIEKNSHFVVDTSAMF